VAGHAVSAVSRPATGLLPAYRLKRSIDCFTASNGSVYLLRTGSGGDLTVREPSDRDRLLLEVLAAGYVSEAALADACTQQGIAADGITGALADLEAAGVVERTGGEGLLSPRERERYDRQLIYFSDLAEPGTAAEELQLRLRDATVVVLGTGGLGTWAACGLACGGVGSLVLVDDDRVDLSNLNRQLLFGEQDLGKSKVETARRVLGAHNSDLRIRTVERRVRGPEDLTDLVAGADLLIVTADWPPYDLPRWVNAACLETGVPYLTAGQMLPLIRIGPLVIPGRSACLECQERQARRAHPLYDELVEFRTANPADAATLGASSGIVGSMLSMEAVHLLTGAMPPASVDAALILDVQTMEITREKVERDPDCPACSGHL
jgi:bacteriocin biosynthesis cyclodehydratase domain-containing protein